MHIALLRQNHAPKTRVGRCISFTVEAVTAIAAGDRHSLAHGRNRNFSYVSSQ